jgi:membrane protein
MKLGNVTSQLRRTVSDWMDHDAQTLGAAIAYFTVLSLAPLLIVALAIAGLVFGRDAARGAIISQLGGLVGSEGAQVIQTVLTKAQSPSSGIIASVLGIVTLLFGASGVFSALRNALNRIWDAKPKEGGFMATVRAQFLSFGMVLGIGFLLLVSLVLSAGLAAMGKYLGGILPVPPAVLEIINLLVTFAVVTLLFALIYRVLPSVSIPWSDVWIGAAVTALLFSLGKFCIGLYLGKASVGSAYGAAGSLIVLLVWVYYSAQIFLFGAEFTHVYSLERGSRAGEEQKTPEHAESPAHSRA